MRISQNFQLKFFELGTARNRSIGAPRGFRIEKSGLIIFKKTLTRDSELFYFFYLFTG
jgi:hypothetical protein